VTTKTNFFAGSTTKAFTAAAVSLLIADNEKYPHVQWTTPVCELIRDDFVLHDEWATKHLTLEDILSHRTGMPSHDRALGRPRGSRSVDEERLAAPRDIVRQLRHLPATKEPRTTYQYCNAMFVTAAHVVQTLTGQWLGDFLRERIWEPLRMNNTYFSTEDATAAGELAKGYYYDEERQEYVEVPNMSVDDGSGAGAVISNVDDYAKWAQAIMTRSDVLPPAAWDEIFTSRTIMYEGGSLTGPQTYALGWRKGVYKGHLVYQHSGGMDAYSAQIVLLPDVQYTVIMFGNTAGSAWFAEQALVWHLIDEKLQVPAADRPDRNKNNLAWIEEGKERAAKAVERFYPNLAETRQPCSLPLADYAGTYSHPGYQTLEVYLDEKCLQADRTKTTWHEHMSFEHVSRDVFVITSNWHGDFAAYYPDKYPAEFRIGADNKVSEVGIGWEASMGKEKIWLKRVSST